MTSSPQSASHCSHLRGREAQPLVRELLAQELELVRREVDDQQAPARRQHARRLAHGALRIAQEVQHLVHDDGVRRLVGERQIVDVALPHLGVRGRRARAWRGRRPAWRGSDRCRGRADSARANSSSMRPVPVPRSTNRSNGPGPSASDTAASTSRLGHVQGADAVPLAGVGLEVGLGRASRAPAARPRRGAGRAPAPDRCGRRASSTSRASSPPSAPLGERGNTPSCPRAPAPPGPASASSFRCRLMRGWLWPRMPREVLDVELARRPAARAGAAASARPSPSRQQPMFAPAVARASPSERRII